VGSAAILDELGKIAPVIVVRGNNDRGAWAASIPEIATTEVGGVRLCVIHDLKTLRGDPASQGVDVLISGHSHRPSIERREHLLLLNPGSAGPGALRCRSRWHGCTSSRPALGPRSSSSKPPPGQRGEGEARADAALTGPAAPAQYPLGRVG